VDAPVSVIVIDPWDRRRTLFGALADNTLTLPGGVTYYGVQVWDTRASGPLLAERPAGMAARAQKGGSPEQRARLYLAAWQKRGAPEGWISSQAHKAASEDNQGHPLLLELGERTMRNAWRLARKMAAKR
jgi:hypothetical protein